jgi:hypothetical protein
MTTILNFLPNLQQDDVDMIIAKSFLNLITINVYLFKAFLESCLVGIRLLRKLP